MSSTAQSPSSSAPQQPAGSPAEKREMPTRTELREIGVKALQVGGLLGGIGTIVGAGSGIMRSAPPVLFGLFAGFQWFALGSSYTASRELLWHAWGGEQNLSSSDKIKASAASGGVSGMVGGLIRGPSNFIPGVLFFSGLAGGATYVSQMIENREPREKKGWLSSDWSPLKVLSDKDYEKILEEKILKLDAEIAILDENIASLKSAKQQTRAEKVGSTALKKD